MRKFFCCFMALLLFFCCETYAEEEQEQVKVITLTIVQEPYKLVYEEGELFDPTGIMINATMSDGTVQENVAYKCRQKKELTTRNSAVVFSYRGKNIEQKITVKYRGNNEQYSVESTPALESSLLAGKTILWLGSSVTYGYGSESESMVEFMDKRNGTKSIKLAVSGTTLADIDDPQKEASYVKRLETYIASDSCLKQVDFFICQLSTNDMYLADTLGEITPENQIDISCFDKATTFGAMEYMIALVRETWNCPIFFYTNSYIENENYARMVQALYQISEKWDVGVIDLYTDAAFNAITPEEKSLYMIDSVHPTRAGYRDWWLKKFEEALQ